MDCIFCEIISSGKGDVVYADNDFICILDHRPVFPGHCLLMPKQHVQTFYDLAADVAEQLTIRAQLIGKAIEKALDAEGSFLAINNTVSQSVPHLHMHLIPRNKKDGLKGFFWPRIPYESATQKTQILDKIRKTIESAANDL